MYVGSLPSLTQRPSQSTYKTECLTLPAFYPVDHLGGSPYSNTNGPTTDVWTVDIGSLELSDSPIFFMTVYGDVNNTIPKFSSSFFNISSASSVPSSTTMSALSPTTMISPSNLTATQTATTAPGAPSNASSSSHNHSSGLSTGAAAGLGAGVAVVALLILSVAAFGWWRHQRKKKLKQIPDRDLHIASPFLTNDEKSGFPLSTELDANDRRGSELPSEDVRRELAAEERVGEMDAIELMEDVEPVEMPTAEVHGEEFRNSRAKASRRSWGVALETLDQSKAGTERE